MLTDSWYVDQRFMAEKELLPLLRLLKLALPYRVVLFFAFLALCLASAINLAIPEIIRRLLDGAGLKLLEQSPAWIASFKSRLVAERMRTLTLIGSLEPTRVISLLSNTRSSLICVGNGMSPTSSRNRVPP